MATLNRTNRTGRRVLTHEGAKATSGTPYQELRRSVMATMLFEPTYYESGDDRAQRMIELCKQVDPSKLREIALEGRGDMHVRHAPLLVTACLAAFHGKSGIVRETVRDVIQRADELAEIVLLFNFVIGAKKKIVLTRQMKLGISDAFHKFDAYQFGKYNRASTAKITMKDIMCLAHPRPNDVEEARVFNGLKTGTLESPDTWEVALSSGADKNETFTRLISEGKLGYMALLRNIRNMEQSGVDEGLIIAAISDSERLKKASVLPFRFIPAFLNTKSIEIRKALLCVFQKSLGNITELDGSTYIMVDVSGSMGPPVTWDGFYSGTDVFEGSISYNSKKGSAKPYDRAIALAEAIRANCVGGVRLFVFSSQFAEVPISHDDNFMSVWKKASTTVPSGATYLYPGVDAINKTLVNAKTYATEPVKTRIIVLTDEQAHDVGGMKPPAADFGYVINVNGYQPTVTNEATGWHSISGWSDKIVDYIAKFEESR